MAIKKKTKTNISKRILKASKPKKIFAIALIVVVVISGILFIYYSFAAGIPVFRDNPDYWRPRIAICESGRIYSNKKNPKYRGAYQFDSGTWKGAVGPEVAAKYPDPADAPAEVQDAAFDSVFARRGTQPWNSSYSCWIKGATVPQSVDDQLGQITNLPNAGNTSPPARPFGVTSASYNVIVNGRVTADNVPIGGVTIDTCSGGRKLTTDTDGRFSLAVPANTAFCVRTAAGIPVGLVLRKTANNVEHTNEPSYENQLAGINCYREFWCFLGASYTWDRDRDAGYNFEFSRQ